MGLSRLSNEYKFVKIAVCDIERTAGLPLINPDVQAACSLYVAGLTCRLGALMFNGVSNDPLQTFLDGSDVKQKLADAVRVGQPVFVGPSADVYNDFMTIISSDASSSSFGLWSPREGLEIHSESIPFSRLK